MSGCFFTREPPRPHARQPTAPRAPRRRRHSRRAGLSSRCRAALSSRARAYGNPPFYDVFGKRYFVLSSSADYMERGVASWYGPGFHKVRTSTGEPYDMYGMTAAHKTLPLPAYVRVTNLQNGRSVVVRVNDRGPFVGNRIIDLSYTAAAKLDMLRNGTAMVEVRTVGPASPGRCRPRLPGAARRAGLDCRRCRAAAPAPAYRRRARSHAARSGPIAPAPVTSAPAAALLCRPAPSPIPRTPSGWRRGCAAAAMARCSCATITSPAAAVSRAHRPGPDVPEFDRIVAALERAGVRDAHLALD